MHRHNKDENSGPSLDSEASLIADSL
jgi:hypothetical protein